MAVVTVDGDQLGEVVIERCTVNHQPDFVAVIGKHSQDNRVWFPVGLEEAAFAIVDDRVANGWRVHVVNRAEVIAQRNVSGVTSELG